jgi:repressor LexA
MALGLSARQRQVLDAVGEGIRRTGEAPTLRELGARLGGMTPAAVHLHLSALARKGYLRWPRGRPRQIELLQPAQSLPALGLIRVPIVGTIAAGEPIDALETPEGHVVIDSGRLPAADGDGRPALFALRVRGDSMVDACIQDGDVVVVHRQSVADDGDTVVALLEGDQATLKRVYREAGRVRLQPANPYYPAIYAQQVAIQGRVVGVVRYC